MVKRRQYQLEQKWTLRRPTSENAFCTVSQSQEVGATAVINT